MSVAVAGMGVFVGVLVGAGVGVSVAVGGMGVFVGGWVGGEGVGVSVAVARMGVFIGLKVGGMREGVSVGVDVLVRSNALTSLASIPCALPSKKAGEVKVPDVELPSDVGLKAKMSSSAPLSPDTEKLPMVDR